jgi:hypothetical protein
MIRIILAKLFAVAAVLTICLPVQPSSAESVSFLSATGSCCACTQTDPCGTFLDALHLLGGGGRVVCITPVVDSSGFQFFPAGTWVFDCPAATMHGALTLSGNAVLKFQHMSFNPGSNMMHVTGEGTLIYEDCVLEDAAGTALDVEPTGPFNLVVTNSRISNNATGVVIKPAAGGSVTATFNGVTIDGNSGGGLKTDTTNGPVSVDIFNSTISKNTGNGLNVVGGAGGPNVLNLSHDVIASNGVAGIQANGVSAAAFVDTTLFDTNAAGATASVSGGRLLTYGNNRIVGSIGSGFPSSVPLQ